MVLLMLQKGTDWTVVVSAISSVVSAIVALIATVIAARTFAQQRADKAEELEYKRPKFTLIRDTLEVVDHFADDYTVNPFYRLTLKFQNRNVHPAEVITLQGKVLQGDKKLLDFVNSPVGEVGQNDTFEVTHDIPKEDVTEKVSYVRLILEYRDGRTLRKHSQIMYRKFYGLPKDVNLTTVEMLEIDRSEWTDYTETHMNIVKARQRTLDDSQKQIKGKDNEE